VHDAEKEEAGPLCGDSSLMPEGAEGLLLQPADHQHNMRNKCHSIPRQVGHLRGANGGDVVIVVYSKPPRKS